ncbi:MAG: ADP-ribosylation factor family protein [Candidatus Hodarchaeota archaeon]
MRAYRKIQQIIPHGSADVRKIAFVGLDLAGKTTTLKRLSRGILENTKPTHGFNTETFTFLGLRFDVFDLGGQDSYQIFWEKFLPEQEGVVFFIDAADTKRLAQVRLALNKTLSLVKENTTIMILANKQDLPNALDVPDLAKALDFSLIAKAKQLRFFAVSAKTGLGIYEAFRWLASALEIDIGKEKCALFGFYVYEKDVGVPLVVGECKTEEYLMKIENPLLSQEPALVTALHSAITSFANEMGNSELQTVSFKIPKSGQTYRLTSVRIENLICVLVMPDKDCGVTSSALGEAILRIVHDSLDYSSGEGLLTNFHLPQVLEVIAPFLENAQELRECITDQDYLPSDQLFIADKTEKTVKIGTTNSGAWSDSEDLEELSIPVRKNTKAESSDLKKYAKEMPVHYLEAQDSSTKQNLSRNISNEDKIASSPDRTNKTSDSFTQQNTQDVTPSSSDEMLFYSMGVAERIKYLQKRRKRLQED